MAGLIFGEIHFRWFSSFNSVIRYSIGAALMGFGGVLAGGCSFSAGLSGAALLAASSLITLVSMVFGAFCTERMLIRFEKSDSAVLLRKTAK